MNGSAAVVRAALYDYKSDRVFYESLDPIRRRDRCSLAPVTVLVVVVLFVIFMPAVGTCDVHVEVNVVHPGLPYMSGHPRVRRSGVGGWALT